MFTVETITSVVVCSLWSGQAATVNETRRPTPPGLEFPPTIAPPPNIAWYWLNQQLKKGFFEEQIVFSV